MEKYKTQKNSPKCVHYWDSKFIKEPFWTDWIMFKEEIEYNLLSDIQENCNCNEKNARRALWNLYVEATEGDEDSPLWDYSGDFVRILSEKELCCYMLHLFIGSDINDGFTEKQSRKRFSDWLSEDPRNGYYGEWCITPKLTIEKVQNTDRK